MNRIQGGRRMEQDGSVRDREHNGFEPSRGYPSPESNNRRQAPDDPVNGSPSRSRALGMQMKNGQIGLPISRPSPVPQWPLGGPLGTPQEEPEYRPPPGRLQPPQRPPRPSMVPSMVDGDRMQEHTPFFQQAPASAQSPEDLTSPETLGTNSTRPSTVSSAGEIPDFPLPATAVNPARRSLNLGPPPSSRRGASTFYSTSSWVSPIPEESPRRSFASSAAIHEHFGGNLSPADSHGDSFLDDTIVEETGYDEMESNGLVRTASTGKRGKPALVTTKSLDKDRNSRRSSTFLNGTAYVDGSDNSSSDSEKAARGKTLTADTMLNAFEAAGATDPSSIRKVTTSPRPFKMSAFRRPPRLDIDAVRDAEARGSLTSLPDLIRRATQLAAIMDRGKRPASRLHDLDFPEEIYSKDRHLDHDLEKHQSGLSDMIAAFPPPAAGSRLSYRNSRLSWPLGTKYNAKGGRDQDGSPGKNAGRRPGRRCCGLPVWAFLLVLLIILCIVAAAVVVPLKLVVFKDQDDGASAQPASNAAQCSGQQACANGGILSVNQGVCSCICSNGFTGPDCSKKSTGGCTTASISTSDSSVKDATMGEAIPRLLNNAQTNFSIPLSANSVTSKFNSADLSCNTQNALVTFNGQTGAQLKRRDTASKSNFEVTDKTLDFSRVVVLYILQENALEDASDAQTQLQNFFATAATGPDSQSGATMDEAKNFTLGGDKTIDLVNFAIDLGTGRKGGSKSDK